jgi:hypothetical protein
MMRRQRFARFRRRPSPYDLQRMKICRFLVEVPASTCDNPFTIVTPIAGPFGVTPAQNFATPDDRGAKTWTWGGCHFQSEFGMNPANAGGATGSNTDIPTIWEAIMKLPFAQGSFTTPAYLPNLTTGLINTQTGDMVDRIVWQRTTFMPFWGVFVQPGIQLQHSGRDIGHGPLQIRSKVRCTEREGMFHVQCHVNGFGNPEVQYRMGWDAWFMQAVKANRR